MKVVIFCGGMGMRLREVSESIPKPMVPIGYRPVLWHLMRYYAHFGHKDFILCLGYRADLIKNYFINYDEWLSNDFVLQGGKNSPDMLHTDIHDWRITFVDTGVQSNIGMRLLAVKDHLKGEEMFLANYADGLTDLNLADLTDFAIKKNRIGTFLSVNPGQSFHTVEAGEDGDVTAIRDLSKAGLNINGGFFVFKNSIFDFMKPGEELVHEPFTRLIQAKQLSSFHYNGFWGCMDTFKDKQKLDELWSSGNAPWRVWKNGSTN